jgi:hypothetical protein
MAIVRRDFGTSLGPPLTMTGLCRSSDHAHRELNGMLGVWARQIRGGQPMTKDEKLEIFGGPNWQNNKTFEQLLAVFDKRAADIVTKRLRDERGQRGAGDRLLGSMQ